MQKTDYDKIASTYNQRYSFNYLVNIERVLKNLIKTNNYKNILEAGCGTGKWINSIMGKYVNVLGLDYSLEMLKIPKYDQPNLKLINADATQMPVKDNFFDLIFCINAIHHFPSKEKFIGECERVLTDKGILAVFGVDPHNDKNWYVYEYFDSVYEKDLNRFPSLEFLKQLLKEKNFVEVKIKTVENVFNQRLGGDVFNDPFLQKNNCSQLANLSDEEYRKGIEKIKNQVNENPKTIFTSSIIFYLISAKKQEDKNAHNNK